MYLRYACIVVGVLLSLSFAYGQEGQGNQGVPESTERYTLKGVVLQMSDSLPVPLVHLYMSDKKSFAVTNDQGRFSISYALGDTLEVSSVQHLTRLIPLNKLPSSQLDTLWLRTRVYTLSGVQVFSKRPLEAFYSHRRIDYNYRSPSQRSILTNKPRVSLSTPTDIVGLSLAFEGVLSALLSPLTSEYKQLKKLQKLKQEKRAKRYLNKLIEEKLSAEFVVRHTHLRKEELSAFLDFWNPSMVQLDVATEYELIDILGKQEKRYITYLEQVNTHRAYQHRVTTLEVRQWLDLSTNVAED